MKDHINRTYRNVFLAMMVMLTQGCYHYRVLNTNNDPSTEYQKTVMWSYAWGLVNNPKDFHVPNCTNSNGLDEVVYSRNFGYSILSFVTLGIVSPIEIRWKCHKPAQRPGKI